MFPELGQMLQEGVFLVYFFLDYGQFFLPEVVEFTEHFDVFRNRFRIGYGCGQFEFTIFGFPQREVIGFDRLYAPV